MIEIMNKDNINEDYFLTPNNDFVDNYKGNDLINKAIYYPKMISENKIDYLKSEIKSIKGNEFMCSTKEILNCVGFPIFLDGTTSVLGIIHKQEKNDIYGYLIPQ